MADVLNLRIAHLIESIDLASGGPSKIAISLASAQAELGQTVRLATLEPPLEPSAVASMVPATGGLGRLDIEFLPRSGRLSRMVGSEFRSQIADQIRGSDLVHVHGIWTPTAFVGAAVSRQMGIPYVVLSNGMLDPWSLRQKRWKKQLALSLYVRRILDGAAALHLGNVDEQRLIAPLGLTSPHFILPNGFFPQEIEASPVAGGFYRRFPSLEGRPFLLFLSRLHFKKGLDCLAEAFAMFARRNPDFALVVAGPGHGAEDDFRARIARHELEERVLLTGPLYGEAKWQALRDATCFVLPSRQEGFSMAIVEALACGKPVIITPECHFPEVAAVGAGLIVPFNAESVAGAMSTICSDSTLASQMSAAAADFAHRELTWPTIARRSIDEYVRILENRQP